MLTKSKLIGSSVLLIVSVAAAAFIYYTVSGGLTARHEPSHLEARLASALVQFSIPTAAQKQKNPLPTSSANLSIGRDLYTTRCVVCHDTDGSGRTEAGRGLYPSPTDLRSIKLAEYADGELAYIIQNGIRNTGMPAWNLAEPQVWQLVMYLRSLPPTALSGSLASITVPRGGYVGSAACRPCHTSIFNRWQKTLMANVVRDPKIHPEAFLPTVPVPRELAAFNVEEIALIYGSRWKQRYFKKMGNELVPLPVQWDVTHRAWRPYFVKDDWWAPLYPPNNFQRPTGPLCDGCHSVNYNIATKTVTEWNVGCEKCHGPGGQHVRDSAPGSIINPGRLDYVQANDVCIQCHSQGRPLTNPLAGLYYDWPVGFEVGKRLDSTWRLESHDLGQTTFTHFPDGTAHKNRMQGNDYVKSLMYTHGVTCSTCHDAHGSDSPALLRKPANTLCLDCHGPRSPYGPFAPSIEAHTHHVASSAGSACVACHMPPVAQTIADVNVRSHTFRFVSPLASEQLKIPNACNICHTDKPTRWAAKALQGWQERSPWRLAP